VHSLGIGFDPGVHVLEGKITQPHSPSIWRELLLPILINIETIEGSFTAEVLESDVADVAGAAGVGFDEGYVVALDDGDVADVLGRMINDHFEWIEGLHLQY